MEKYFKLLDLSIDATFEEVESKYKYLSNEFDPVNHSDDLKDFFKSEQDKIDEAYKHISLSFSNKNDC